MNYIIPHLSLGKYTTRLLIMLQTVLGLLNATSIGQLLPASSSLDYPTAIAGNPFVDGW